MKRSPRRRSVADEKAKANVTARPRRKIRLKRSLLLCLFRTQPKIRKKHKTGKRKAREESHDADGKSAKVRRIPENGATPVPVSYTPPDDLAKSISDLPGSRTGPAKAMSKSISHVLTSMQKQGELDLEEGNTIESMTETFSLQIERAVYDSYPVTKGQKEYNQQIKSLSFNLKNNPELCHGLVHKTLSPAALATMTSEQLASSEMKKQTAEMKAKAEKQSILYTSETGPRVRRTHKGEEVVDDETFVNDSAVPLPPGPPRRPEPQAVKKEPTGGDKADLASHPQQQDDKQRSPSHPDFDINEVFSSVKSPTTTQNRRPSALVTGSNGPGVDPDVDRMLQDENESPPYSPTEETQDPDVIWQGSLAMSSIADFPATAKYIGGANFASVGPWSKLIPKRMTVAGRIPEQSAIEYLCSLRYSNSTDVIVVSVSPVSPFSHTEFHNLLNYFTSKKRYGVIGDKTIGNVRDTYLVPVPAGEDNYPEFMLNLVDNKIPKVRTEPILLAVFVYHNEPDQLKHLKDGTANQQDAKALGTPVPAAHAQRSNSTASAGPAFSPATPRPLREGFKEASLSNHHQANGSLQLLCQFPSHRTLGHQCHHKLQHRHLQLRTDVRSTKAPGSAGRRGHGTRAPGTLDNIPNRAVHLASSVPDGPQGVGSRKEGSGARP
ncbi:Transcription factor bye1 [Fusarium oxysporum]|nr:Transcription factor bye1 [Fusarium oxysporum]